MNMIWLQSFIFVVILDEIFGRNHFDADVFNNRFKVRRLIKFKLDLCQVIRRLGHQNVNGMKNNEYNKYVR